MFKSIEVTVGMFVGIGLAALFMLSMQVSNLSNLTNEGTYQITARFDNIGGLKNRSAVKVSGVRVGQVQAIDYDSTTFEAVVTMNIEEKFNQFPKDTIASIFTSGLLGEQYVGLEPGGDLNLLAAGSEINHTQSAMVMEQIIGQFLFSKSDE
ncbi:MAG: outer membrane lipid asymmetry maintenance protein MlaD [Gammaproteobacteria bacterium]|nr:outer membrane lipid asymmetry maintenance protein MlaD [Gammaproteobacteria bacterium]